MDVESTSQARRRRSRAEVEELVCQYEASGLGRVEFCRTHALSLSTLNRYCKRRLTHGEAAGVGSWVAVELSSAGPAAGGRGSGLTVLLSSGRRIEVGQTFDPNTLERLIAALERV